MKDDSTCLRDKMALEILNGFLSRPENLDSVKDFIYYIDQENSYNNGQKTWAENQMEKMIKASYRMADMMRKIRLTPFE